MVETLTPVSPSTALARREKPGDHLMADSPPRRAARTSASALYPEAPYWAEPGKLMTTALPALLAVRLFATVELEGTASLTLN